MFVFSMKKGSFFFNNNAVFEIYQFVINGYIIPICHHNSLSLSLSFLHSQSPTSLQYQNTACRVAESPGLVCMILFTSSPPSSPLPNRRRAIAFKA